MGQVWLATNLATEAEVAVKVLLPSRAASHDAITRFRREAEATAALSHRGIVRVFDLVELDPAQGALVLVMEVLRGETLGERLEREGRLSVGETLRIMSPILSALAHAHARGVVHRDLKPENVVLALDPDGAMIPKLVDFGISKSKNRGLSITIDGELVGTPCYMSPEQAKGREVDERSDVFAAGIVLYECLAGGNPFVADGLHAVIKAVCDREPAPIGGVPKRLWKVVAKALEKDPADRYATARELACALELAAPSAIVDDGLYSLPWSVSAAVSSQRRSRGGTVGIAIAACAAGALVASVAASSWALRPVEVARERAARSLGVKVIAPNEDALIILEPQRELAAPRGLESPRPARHEPVAPRRTTGFDTPVLAPIAPPQARVSFARDPGF